VAGSSTANRSTKAATLEIQVSSELSKLHGHPFSPTVSVDRPYLSSSFREALASLYYGLEYGTRVLLLSAEGGVGKTTVLRYWERRIQQRGRTLFVSSNADNAFDALQNLMVEIGGSAPGDLKATGFQTDDIPRTLATSGKLFILLLDFNEDSAGSTLEVLNHLTKLESFKTGSLRIVIALPDNVAEDLRSSEFANDIQRVPLAPLKASEVDGYIEHRLRTVGWRGGPLFTSRGYAAIAEGSSGKPSIINEICSKLLEKLSESENGSSDTQDRNQKIPLDQPFVDSVLSVKTPAGTEPSHNVIDQGASRTPQPSRRAATIVGIVLILVIAIAGFWYEIATKANSAKRLSSNPIPTPVAAPHAAIPQDSTVAPLPGAAHETTAKNAAVNTAPFSAVAVHVAETPRAVSPSPAAVSVKDAGYSGPVDQQGPKFSSTPLAGNTSASAIATLSSAPDQTQPTHTAIASGEAPRSAEQAGAVKPRLENMAAYEIRLGDTYMKRGEYDKALFRFSRALAFTPDDQEAQEKIKRARRAKTAEENVLQ
jgi:general secretion pathway protein A